MNYCVIYLLCTVFFFQQNSDILSQADVFEIDCQLSATTRVEKLLDILLTKGGGSFQALCVTLETTYPSLLTAMFLGNTNIRSGGSID